MISSLLVPLLAGGFILFGLISMIKTIKAKNLKLEIALINAMKEDEEEVISLFKEMSLKRMTALSNRIVSYFTEKINSWSTINFIAYYCHLDHSIVNVKTKNLLFSLFEAAARDSSPLRFAQIFAHVIKMEAESGLHVEEVRLAKDLMPKIFLKWTGENARIFREGFAKEINCILGEKDHLSKTYTSIDSEYVRFSQMLN